MNRALVICWRLVTAKMASNELEVVGESHYGGGFSGDTDMREWKRIRFVIHDFQYAQTSEHCIRTSSIKCHGHHWGVKIYPRGVDYSDDDDSSGGDANDEAVDVFLSCMTAIRDDTKVKTEFRLSIVTPSSPPKSKLIGQKKYEFSKYRLDYGWNNAIRSSAVDGWLFEDALTIQVDIRVALNDGKKSWKPPNTLSVDMLKMLETADADNSDVIFEVGKGRKTKKKKGKELFHAHSLILKSRAPILASLTEDVEEGTPIPVEDMDPAIFCKILRFIYGGEVPSKDVLKSEARTIIRASDRFGVTGLKLSAEAELASAGIDVDNCAELILFADGTNCAILKEAAIDYFVANSADVMASDGYEQIEQSPSITKELMLAMAAGSKKRHAEDSSGGDIKRMRVSTLRQKLDEKGLDVDGSKEMLVARLLENEAAAEE